MSVIKKKVIDTESIYIGDSLENAGIIAAVIKFIEDQYLIKIQRDQFYVSLRYENIFDDSKEDGISWAYSVVLTPIGKIIHDGALPCELKLVVCECNAFAWEYLRLDYDTQVRVVRELLAQYIN